MRVVVTGGAGFIGRSVVAALRQRGDEVAVVDHHGPEMADVGDPEALARALAPGAGAVVHLAARTSVLGTVADPLGTVRVNVEATAQVAEACRTSGVGRLVFASTNAVVGDAVAAGQLIDEGSALAPLTPYGASKAAAEMVLSAYQHGYGLKTTVVRLTNVYGPQMAVAGKDTVIVRMLRCVAEQTAFDVYGSGEQVRDFVHVDDVARAMVAAVDGRLGDGVVTYGAGRSVSVLDLARLVEATTGRALALSHLAAKPGEMPAVRVDIARARSFGLAPVIDLPEGMAGVWAAMDRPAAPG